MGPKTKNQKTPLEVVTPEVPVLELAETTPLETTPLEGGAETLETKLEVVETTPLEGGAETTTLKTKKNATKKASDKKASDKKTADKKASDKKAPVKKALVKKTPVEQVAKSEKKVSKSEKKLAKKEKSTDNIEEDEHSDDDTKTRSFKVKLPGDESFTGRFTGLTPYQAANKALSKYFRGLETEDNSQVNFSIRESTRGSKRHEYVYKGSRLKLEKPIIYTIKSVTGDERIITKQYKNQLIKIKKGIVKQESVTV